VTKLQAAIKDEHKRYGSKKARYCPNYKDKPSAGKPVIRCATVWHKKPSSGSLSQKRHDNVHGVDSAEVVQLDSLAGLADVPSMTHRLCGFAIAHALGT